MEKTKLIALLNKDLTDEHAAILRYLIHAYQEGEETPLGANLLSRSREEMWHMHWLGLIITELDGEPNMTPAPYPFDPQNRRTILQSYVDYELKLIPHYMGEADLVDDPHIKRVLQREAWESSIHARKFERLKGKMKPELAEGQPGGTRKISVELLDHIQKEVSNKYLEMIQHVRHSWVFQQEASIGWKLMDQSMEKMKQLSKFAEITAENGMMPPFKPYQINQTRDLKAAIEKALDDVASARDRHFELRKNSELENNAGAVINMDLTLDQEAYNRNELTDWLAELKGK